MNVAFEDFMNQEVIITVPGDPRLPCQIPPGVKCFYLKKEDGPTYIIVRATADDEFLQRLAERLSIPLADLKQVCDQQLTTGTPS